ncbi:hypothetical protein HYC85_009557 [Camellia sinensis]|uniref:Uncharacterized protein n=1 Tax=Camellia sinensis TaxID=4442 RepID=A0A7J7HFB0_CAMSI|nr:hypothetical protein HYC85_009557 [Camellia sinensis]
MHCPFYLLFFCFSTVISPNPFSLVSLKVSQVSWIGHSSILLFTAFLLLASAAIHGAQAVSMLTGTVFCDQCKDGQISLFDYPLYAKSLRLVFRIFDMEMYTVDPLLSEPAQPMSMCPRSYAPVSAPVIPVTPPVPVEPPPVARLPPLPPMPRLPPLPPLPPMPSLEASACPYWNWTMPGYECYWKAVTPDMKVAVVFGLIAARRYGTDMTLRQGMEGRGDPYRTLLREGTTALLNSYNSIQFPYHPLGVIHHMNWALLGSTRLVLHTAIRFMRANSGSGKSAANSLPAKFMAIETNAQTSIGMVAAIAPTPPPIETVLVNYGEKPEKFLGTDFKRWQQKMLFYLTTLNLARFLREDAPSLKENEIDRQVVAAVNAWNHADFLYRNYVLNGLDNTLYNVYSPIKTAKELWESLEKKYKIEDARSKKFVVGKFLNFVIIDSKTVISQVQDLQLILHDIHAEGMSLSESFKVVALIEKLP